MPVFLAPWFLIAGAAAALPVALHLLQRRRPKPMPFSTLRFLLEAVSRTRRSRHLTNFLALLMRVLIILLLACAFSRPKARFAAWLPQAKRMVVVVLDASASMQCQDGEDTCFDQAKAWASKLVRSLDEGDRVALIVPGLTEPRLVFPAISDHEAASRAIDQVEGGYGAVSLAEALRDLLARLPTSRESLGVEIHIFSDFQRSGWDAAEMETLASQLAQDEILLFLNHVKPGVAANAGIAKAAFYPPAILGEGYFQARTDIRASADYSGSNTLRLSVNAAEQARHTFDLLPDQTIKTSLAATVGGTGEFVKGQLELDHDGFAPDNVFRFCLPRLPGIPVLLVDGSARGSTGTRDIFFLRNAIQPQGKAMTLFLPKTVDWQSFLASDPAEFRVVFVCNPPSLDAAAAAKLEGYVRNGGTAVLMPGQHDVLDSGLPRLKPLTGVGVHKEILPQEKSMAVVPSTRPAELEKRLLTVMPPPPALVLRRRLLFAELPANATHVFEYHDGAPFLFEVTYGQGTFWVCSVSANRDWSEWPLTPFFVVLQQELIKSSARRNLSKLVTSVGGVLALDWAEDLTELDFRMSSPSGADRMLNLTRVASSSPLIFSGFEEPGFYELERDAERRVIAVNVPEQEGDLAYLGRAELAVPLGEARVYQADTWHRHQQNLVNLHHGRPLWPFLLCCAFLIAITEEIFANLRSRAAGLPETLQQFLKRGGRGK